MKSKTKRYNENVLAFMIAIGRMAMSTFLLTRQTKSRRERRIVPRNLEIMNA
jgi:hypothetical protein